MRSAHSGSGMGCALWSIRASREDGESGGTSRAFWCDPDSGDEAVGANDGGPTDPPENGEDASGTAGKWRCWWVECGEGVAPAPGSSGPAVVTVAEAVEKVESATVDPSASVLRLVQWRGTALHEGTRRRRGVDVLADIPSDGEADGGARGGIAALPSPK